MQAILLLEVMQLMVFVVATAVFLLLLQHLASLGRYIYTVIMIRIHAKNKQDMNSFFLSRRDKMHGDTVIHFYLGSRADGACSTY